MNVCELADRWGIAPAYHDIFGNWRETSPETCRTLLDAMGSVPERPLPPDGPRFRVLGPGESLSVSAASQLTLEDGTVLRVEHTVPPDLPLGYHDLRPLDGGNALRIIKSPGACYLDSAMRIWGWAVQLYAARSTQSWGLGDLADLRRLAQWSAKLGAGALLLNPLSAVAPVLPQEPSPYYPSSRRFRNPLYLSVAEVPGAGDMGLHWEALAVSARELNRVRRIDRDQVFRLKMEALNLLWQRRPDEPAFRDYCCEQGESLKVFGLFCALAERLGGNWRLWPETYRRPDDPDVARFAAEHAERVEFHKWLQWLIDQQLAHAARPLPLVQDLPIGVDPRGADAWQWQDVLATDVTVGAPPDHFNADGQDWSLPPFNPARLRAAGYQPFIETLRAAFRHAGGLRIDHVMGLFRLYWIPAGRGPKFGAYVRYPADELLALVAVESHRAKAWVAGEDLGTVEPEVRRRLAEYRMLSYRLLWFEDTPPRHFPELAMAAITTHDLPTIAGIWSGSDFAAQERLGLSPDRHRYDTLRGHLQRAAGLHDGVSTDEAISRGYAALAQAPSHVVVANLDDALAVEERPNMPGTIQQWPNWSIALPQPLEDIVAAPLPRAVASALAQRS